MDKQEIENRLTQLAIDVLEFSAEIEKIRNLRFICDQLRRSGTAPALIYAEAQHAESHKDFLHKIKFALKETKEASICIKIITHFLSEKETAMRLFSEFQIFVKIFTKTSITLQHKLDACNIKQQKTT